MKKIVSAILIVVMIFNVFITVFASTSDFDILAFEYYDDDASFVEYCAHELECDISDFRVVNNVIYKLSKNGKYYSVEHLFDTVGTAKNAIEVEIVDYIDDVPVTTVNDCLLLTRNKEWSYGNNLKRVKLPNTIKRIGRKAFGYLPNLEDIVLPDSITTMKSGVFYENKKIKTINIPKNLNNNQRGSFSAMYGLKTIYIPETMQEIPDQFFIGCKSLSKVVFEGDCIKIGSHAFRECKSLKSIDFPESLSHIGRSAFLETGLEEITIPKACKVISANAFDSCKKLKKVVLKGKNKTVKNYIFLDCENLEEVIGSENISYYRVGIFENCKSLKKYTIGKNIERIGRNVFKNCKNLKNVKILTKNTKVFNEKTFSNMPKTCKTYVKTKAMREIVFNCGFKGKVNVKKNVK